jgi:hypothetical protein
MPQCASNSAARRTHGERSGFVSRARGRTGLAGARGELRREAELRHLFEDPFLLDRLVPEVGAGPVPRRDGNERHEVDRAQTHPGAPGPEQQVLRGLDRALPCWSPSTEPVERVAADEPARAERDRVVESGRPTIPAPEADQRDVERGVGQRQRQRQR